MSRRPRMSTRSLGAIVAVVVAGLLVLVGRHYDVPLSPTAPATSSAPSAAGLLLPPASATSGCTVVAGKADRRCTPGATYPAVTQATIGSTICHKGWTATVRPPVAYTENLKRAGLAAYGESGPLSGYEEDHFIPLEVGGSPDEPSNLWPEPHPSSYTKDGDENRINHAVCAGQMTLAQGQRWFIDHWSHT